VGPDDEDVGSLLGRDLEDPLGGRSLLEADPGLETRAGHAAEQAIEPLLGVAARAAEEILVHLGRDIALDGKEGRWRDHVQEQDLGAQQPPEPPGLVPGRLRRSRKVCCVEDLLDRRHWLLAAAMRRRPLGTWPLVQAPAELCNDGAAVVAAG
jgi:hypothetical protein